MWKDDPIGKTAGQETRVRLAAIYRGADQMGCHEVDLFLYDQSAIIHRNDSRYEPWLLCAYIYYIGVSHQAPGGRTPTISRGLREKLLPFEGRRAEKARPTFCGSYCVHRRIRSVREPEDSQRWASTHDYQQFRYDCLNFSGTESLSDCCLHW
jgi:hypothetical protein